MSTRVLIIAEHASLDFGGEAALPLHYFRVLRKRGHQVWLLVHERTVEELNARFGKDAPTIFVRDTKLVRFLWAITQVLPQRIAYFSSGYLMRVLTQAHQKKLAQNMIRKEAIDVVHVPMPVSPREPSLLYNLGAPVIFGPMNGAMDYPPGFRRANGRLENTFIKAGRSVSNLMNQVFPGKRRAAALLVANERTRHALPRNTTGDVIELVENGVDLSLWNSTQQQQAKDVGYTRFVFMGRLIALKGVDFLLEAFKTASKKQPMSLLIIGEGPEREKLEKIAHKYDLLAKREEAGKVTFKGWCAQDECAKHLGSSDALILPSLMECGGAVILEAMAMARPVIATDWGGPPDYLDETCGILVPPTSPGTFVEGLENAMSRLAQSRELREKMGKAGAEKIANLFDWDVKVNEMLELYDRISNKKHGKTPA